MAKGGWTSESDIDMLVVCEPHVGVSWTANDNVTLRRQCEAAVAVFPVPIDLWVRTTAQFADAGRVYGGVEYWARESNTCLYERPRRRDFPLPENRDATRTRLTREAFRDAQHLFHTAISYPERRDECLARAAQRAILAVMIYHKADCLRKTDTPSHAIQQLSNVDAELYARVLSSVGTCPKTAPAVASLLSLLINSIEARMARSS